MKKKRTLRRYIGVVCVCAVIITVLAVGIISYELIKNSSVDQLRKVDSWLVKQQSENVSYLIEKFDAFSLDLAFDTKLQDAFSAYNFTDSYDLNIGRIEISKIFSEKYSYSNDFINMIAFSLDGRVLGMKEKYDTHVNIADFSWYEAVEKSQGENVWLEPGFDPNGAYTKDTLCMPMVRKVRSNQNRKKRDGQWDPSTLGLAQGYLLVYVNMDAFTELMNEDAVKDLKTFLLVDKNQQIIGSMNKAMIGSDFAYTPTADGMVDFYGEPYLLTTDTVEGSDGWQFIILTKASEVTREANQALLICLAICGVLTGVLLIMTAFLTRRINHPVNVLHTFFKKAETENVAITEESRFVEFNDLYLSFNHMVDKIYTMSAQIHQKELMQQELETVSRESQIGALQMQINPHFLYNTLDCINWTAQMNGDQDVSEMILTLGKFFRSNIEMRGIYTSIWQEIKNIELYMSLAKLRYRNRLSYTIEVDPGLYELSIIKLLLQPLVENSMKYGLDKIAGDECIHLWIGEEDDSIIVSVSDDGAGMDAEQLQDIRSMWERIGDDRKDIHKVGLYNIMRRLYLCYRKDCTFEIFSELNYGTNVVITYPKEYHAPEAGL